MIPKTGIEYLDRVYNVVKGRCPNTGCPVWKECYMKRPPSSWSVDKNPTLRFDEKAWCNRFPDEPSRIGVGFNIELFHPEIPSWWIQRIITEIEWRGKDHTFIFLTKNPARYAEFDFPQNCWLGVTVTKYNEQHLIASLPYTNLRFVSYEPLLNAIPHPYILSDWIIVGAMTGVKSKKYQPKKGWIERLVEVSKLTNIPIFMKDNLQKVWGKELIQQFPKAR